MAVTIATENTKGGNNMDMGNYPEHTKLDEVKDESQSIGNFLDWLSEEAGYGFSQWWDEGNNGEPKWLDNWYDDGPITDSEKLNRSNSHKNPKHFHPDGYVTSGDIILRFDYNPTYQSWESGWYSVYVNIENLLGDYFGIDPQKLGEEKSRMLNEFRAVRENMEKNG